MPLSADHRAWFLTEIEGLDPTGEVVAIEDGGSYLRYCETIRSDETRQRKADPEELVRALTILLLCSPQYGYSPERLYIEQTHSIGRPSSSTAQVDLVIYFEEEDGSESAFALWEMKAPDAYKPDSDPLIEHQLFAVAPLVVPSLLVYSTVRPCRCEIECLTIDYTAHKSFTGWESTGREAT